MSERRRFNVVHMKAIGQQAGDTGMNARRNKFDPVFCTWVVDWAKEGQLMVQWARNLCVTIQTLYDWANAYPEFEEAMQMAFTEAGAHWTALGISNMKNPTGEGTKKFDTRLYLAFMQSSFPELMGPSAKAHQDNFKRRNDAPPKEERDEAARALDPATMDAKIEELLARRKHMET